MTIKNKNRFAFVIPVYNHAGTVARVVKQAQAFRFPVFVVDDGSTDNTYDQIKDIADITILRHEQNQGKGAAILTGFAAASSVADFAITIDADGQHYPEDARNLINAIPENSRPIVAGARVGMTGKNVPWTSSFGRKFSNFWVQTSGGPKISDSQSGFRIYPLPEALQLKTKARRFQFEVEILAHANRNGIPVIEAPIRVRYNPEGGRISHFRPFVDFCRNSSTFTRLIFRRIFFLK
ncbi:MAG: glycosyltransferase family 2 protein [Deltaproteobacteria bacterium HGW-Deltaproteobacteria-13]|jgi:glycosyltransferase involved in cell wall biosynthesis|nr:MAG: glycosyltransferase family 2 protein [Deltaproteobacteria bacterium HGW-Deltaproteobacteria-13]